MKSVNPKIIKAIIIVVTLLCITSFLFYYTRPISLNHIFKSTTINEIYVITNTKLPEKLNLDSENDINAVVDILSRYKYSRKLNG